MSRSVLVIYLKFYDCLKILLEPIICEGSPDYVMWNDGWTVASKDKKLAAQHEDTIIVKSDGCEIITV